MPTLEQIQKVDIESLELPTLKWVEKIVGLRKGGIYLLAGEPGIGKTTISVNILGSIASSGKKCLYLTNEQTDNDIKLIAKRIFDKDGVIPKDVGKNFSVEHLRKIDDLTLWKEHIFRPNKQYSDVSVIVIDSVQGGGTSATSHAAYRSLYSFANVAKKNGVTVILIGHITKNGKIAGPKDLEHEVDVVLYIRRAFNLRPLFVPKNRFGPARMDPYILIMDKGGKLKPSPHTKQKNSIVYGAGMDPETFNGSIVEIQANVALPRFGEKPKIRSPYLPREKIRQLLDVLGRIPDIDVGSLSHDINSYVRGGKPYHFGLDLPLAVAIIGSYLRVNMPENSLFMGEIDLNGRIRAPSHDAINWISKLFEFDGDASRLGIKKLYVSDEVGSELESLIEPEITSVEITRVGNVSEMVQELWPNLTNGRELLSVKESI